MIKRITLLIFLSSIGFLNAQLTDLARLEYSFIPKKKSDDEYTRIRALFNYPIELKNDKYIFIGAEYNNIFLNLNDNYPFDKSLLETLTILDINLGYTYKINDKWRAGFKLTPRLASTLTEKITGDDLFLNGGMFFVKDRTKATKLKKPYRLILGLTYNTTTGIPFPLPFVSYFRQINESWSFNAGVPKSNIKYSLNDKNDLQAFVGIDGYFAHLQRPATILDKEVDHISLSVVISGLGYEYLLSKHLVLYAYCGYTLRMNNVLRDKDRENVFTLDNVNAQYLRTGIKFKI
ncbi:DUF6268 family outer membrane beta-barrel protein [Polaribacter sp. Asnod6-C07]|uniref:DUF6268 family outer membrane beta-barrel protein n=1 Tax=Polaribacter sp. Asnod6-C07 TaxID=3160582 RepID=UPI00386B9076